MTSKERYTAPVQALLTPTQREQLRHEADRRGMTTSNLARNILAEWLQAHRNA